MSKKYIADSFAKIGGTSAQFLKADGSTDSSILASEGYVDSAITTLVDSSPATLDTLNELAAALGDDPNFATTVSTSIGTKLSNTTDTFTGVLTVTSDIIVDTDIYTNQDGLKIQSGGTSGTYLLIDNASEIVSTNHELIANNLSGTNTGDQDLSAYALASSVTGTNSGTNTGDQDLSGYVETATLGSYIRSDLDDIFTGRLTGNQMWLGGSAITGQGASTAKLQVNGFQETGNIRLHEGGNTPTANWDVLENNAGDLEWGGEIVYHTNNLDLGGFLLNTTDTLDGSLTVDGGTGVATSSGTLIVKQKGDTIADGIAITSSNATSHRIWKDSSGSLNMGGSGAGSSFVQDLSGNLSILGTATATNFILSSDKRLKNNVEEVNNNHIDVNWKTFEMNSEEGQSRYGVIAQELEEVHPEFVRTDKEGMKSVAYIDLLIAKIAELEARLDKANI